MANRSRKRQAAARVDNDAEYEDDGEDDRCISMGNRQAKDYFSSRKFRKKSKEDKKISGVQLLNVAEVRKELTSWDDSHKEGVPAFILEQYEAKHFDTWRNQLFAGFNLLFTGFGSKVQLLQAFGRLLGADENVLHVHGYLPSVSMRYIVAFLFEKLFRKKLPSGRSLEEQCIDLGRLLAQQTKGVCIIVHSIDGIALRSGDTQKAWSLLAQCPQLYLVASVDHVNAASLWDESETKRFSWLEHTVNTLAPYTNEVLVTGWSGAMGRDDKHAVSGIQYILESLTPSDLATLRHLGSEQLKGQSLSYKQWETHCCKHLLATPAAMRNTRKVLEEHGLILLSRNDAVIRIPFGDHVIQQIILDEAALDEPQS
ncbi:origin recognition complex subunit [Achlya hypogyna]|uniref:Origin recognition complex subunit 2 n=1 Tax=Achlya hypogyna TaxID=1202772 RepID=A0A1V9ZIR2_ACHHY|nr:origin recognition complex subunit [Achlya hypogyna]